MEFQQVFYACYFCAYVLSHAVMSASLWSHGLWPFRLLCPWDFPGKNTGAGCHFLLQGSPNLAIELQSPVSPALQANSLSTEPLGFGSVGFSSPLILIFHSLFQQLRQQHHQGQLMNIWAHRYKAGLCRPGEEGQEGWEKYTEAKVQRNCGEAALGQGMRIYYFSQPPLPLPDTHFNIAVIDLCMGLGEKVATM